MRVRLRTGVEVDRAIRELHQLAGSKSTAIGATSRVALSQQEDYVRWSLDAEAGLQSVLNRDDVASFFNTPRHLAICSMPPANHLTRLIYAQLDALQRDFMEAVDQLKRRRDRIQASGGLPVVIDTMVLLQCQRLDQVKWIPVVGEETRVMVPLRVLEEIEDKKYSESKRLRRRARELLPWIDKHFTDGSPGPVHLAEGATLELVLAERPRYRPDSADDEILEVAHETSQYAGRVKVMTGDTGMRSRARGEGLDVLALPDSWRLQQVDD